MSVDHRFEEGKGVSVDHRFEEMWNRVKFIGTCYFWSPHKMIIVSSLIVRNLSTQFYHTKTEVMAKSFNIFCVEISN